MPTEREMGERRHAFVEWHEVFMGGSTLPRGGNCKLCGLPPDAEVHRAGQGQSTYDLYAARERAAACGKFNPCQLGDSGLPDHNFTCALLCQDCGMNEPAHVAPLPFTEKPAIMSGSPLNWEHALAQQRLSTPATEKPAEACGICADGDHLIHGCDFAPPPAQPEGEPKRFGGKTREEWEKEVHCYDRSLPGWLSEYTLLPLIAAAFGERALLVRAQEGGAAMRKIMKACEPALLFAAFHGVGLCPPEESRKAQADIDAFDALLSDLDSALKGER